MTRKVRQIGKMDPREHSECHALCCPEEESVVQQQFGDEVDINSIMRRFGPAAFAPVGSAGVYGDLTGITDFASASEKVRRAEASFMKLDAEVRERFKNDPNRFLDAIAGMDVDEVEAFVRPRKSAEGESKAVEARVSPPGGDSGGSGGGSASGDGAAQA